jgi:hypothetical protein
MGKNDKAQILIAAAKGSGLIIAALKCCADPLRGPL